MMSFIVIIPARFASTRLPSKPLVDIAGKTMVVRVMEQAQKSGAERVIVATDHLKIAETVALAGGEVCMTRTEHHSGTTRLAEVIEQLNIKDQQIIVNVQGDEPFLPPILIQQVAKNLVKQRVDMATLAVPITSSQDVFNPNSVKVVRDKHDLALYFSRAPIPWDRNQFDHAEPVLCDGYLRHIGLYAYRAGFIRQYIEWQESELEKIELLEQLRILWYGGKIHVALAEQHPPAGIDTLEDLEKAIQFAKQQGV